MATEKNTIYQKMAQLDELMEWFDGDDFVIDESFEKFGEAEKLAAEINAELKEFQHKVTLLQQKFDKEE